jgi:O-antigen/teichoic acid export membrane protein
MKNLRNRTLTGLFWNLAERLGIQALQFIPTVILARLLTPEQFGLIGMLSLFIAIVNVFLDSGFGAALIRKQDATHLDQCSIFYFNIVIGGISVIGLFYAAPWIADFYQQPLLIELTRWLSLDILINSFSLIQTTLLVRQLNFKAQFKANLFATLASGVIGIAAAYWGLGVWSLVIQAVARTLLRTGVLWLICDWRPALIFSLKSLWEMFGFGSRMLLSSLISTFFDNLYPIIIGKIFSAVSLGFYTRAASMKTLVIDTTSNTLSRVLYPALASIQDDLTRLKRAYRKSVLLSTFVHFPLMIGLIVVASPLINWLFSEKWESSVLFFQLMCAGGLLYPLQLINLEILKVKGRSDLFFRLEIIKRSLVVISIFITYPWGISAMLVGQIGVVVSAYFLNSFYSERLIGYPMKSQLMDALPAFVFSGLMAGGMLLVALLLPSSSDFIRLVVQTGVGLILYFFLNWVTRSEALFEILALAKQFLHRSTP